MTIEAKKCIPMYWLGQTEPYSIMYGDTKYVPVKTMEEQLATGIPQLQVRAERLEARVAQLERLTSPEIPWGALQRQAADRAIAAITALTK